MPDVALTLPRPETRVAARATHDLYGAVHKGVRLALMQLLVRLGATDFQDAEEAARMVLAVRAQLALSASHMAHEEAHIHIPLRARSAAACVMIDYQHDHHRQRFAEIAGLLSRMETAPAAARSALGRDLYLAFSLFAAEDLAHMHEEETVTLPLLQRLFTDAELMAMERAIAGSIPGPEMITWMRVMLPAMSRPERGLMLAHMRDGAPEAAYEAVLLHAARPTLTDADWADLMDRLAA